MHKDASSGSTHQEETRNQPLIYKDMATVAKLSEKYRAAAASPALKSLAPSGEGKVQV